MSRFVCLCRILPTCAARTMPVNRKLCPAAVSSARFAAPLIQQNATCWVDSRAFSLSTQCMKKANTKPKKQKKQKKSKAASMEEEDELEPEVGELLNIKELTEEMENALEHMQKEFIKSVTLRPSAATYENLSIETTHGKFPLNQIAQVAIQGPVVIINMAVSPQYIKDVDDALRKGLNVNPQVDGTTLTLPVPKITKEYRQEMVERVKTIAENSKEVIRHIRSKYVKKLNSVKAEESEDTMFEYTNKINSKVKLYTEKIATLAAKRSKEINA